MTRTETTAMLSKLVEKRLFEAKPINIYLESRSFFSMNNIPAKAAIDAVSSLADNGGYVR